MRRWILATTLCSLLTIPAEGKTPPGVSQRLSYCGKEYASQFAEALEQERLAPLSKQEKAELKEKEIPYAMARNIGVGIIDFDGNGTKDYLGFSSKSAVDNCSVTAKPFEKRNELYLEINGVGAVNETWVGNLILSVDVTPAKKRVIVKEINREGELSYRQFMYK